MSKERKLLKRAVRIIESLGPGHEAYNLIDKIEELLAQPKHIPDVGNMGTQEPVYWENEKKALLNEIDHLTNRLAQPELSTDSLQLNEQAPVAWLYARNYGEDGLFVECVTTDYWEIDDHQQELGICSNIRPLYTAPPKRERLSEDEIFNIGYKAGFAIDHVESDDGESTDYGFIDGDGYIDNDLVFKFVRGIEKAHGIGGEE